MRMSCNGCRVLRKGCSDDCIIRPCLQWIKSSDAQANATLFLAKFYGRAGLINLIQAGPLHLRPAVFRSLLYEACGRMINPVCGSVGLLWSGNWAQCQSAVDSVLREGNVPQISSSDADAQHLIAPLRANYDIRHVSRDPANSGELNKVKNRTRFKRPVHKPSSPTESSTRIVGESSGSGSWASQLGNADNETQYPNPGFHFNDDANQLGLDLTLALVPNSNPVIS